MTFNFCVTNTNNTKNLAQISQLYNKLISSFLLKSRNFEKTNIVLMLSSLLQNKNINIVTLMLQNKSQHIYKEKGASTDKVSSDP